MFSDQQCCSPECIIRAQQGDQNAKDTVIDMHQPLLWSLAKRLRGNGTGCEELVQAGNVGLLYALERYNAQRQVKLSTYAVPWILGEMRRTMKRIWDGTISIDEAFGEEGQNLHGILVGCPDMDIAQLDLHWALSKLEYEERLLICLRFFQDQSQKQAALLMGKSQTQISRVERRILDTLREMLM